MSVGSTLAQARAEHGLSVADVAATTRIRASLIAEIENDDFGGCGGAVYARGHIRSIARAVGVDPAPLVEEFDREHSTEPAPSVVPTHTIDRDAAASAEPRRPNWTAAMAVALVAICVLAAVSLLSGTGHKAGRPSAEATHRAAPRATSSPTPSAPAASPPASAQADAGPRNAAVALVRVTSSQTWMSVTTLDGRTLFQGLLTAGSRKVFRDHKGLHLVIGNAPAVDLVANGRDIGAPKSQGNVARLTIQRGSQVQYA